MNAKRVVLRDELADNLTEALVSSAESVGDDEILSDAEEMAEDVRRGVARLRSSLLAATRRDAMPRLVQLAGCELSARTVLRGELGEYEVEKWDNSVGRLECFVARKLPESGNVEGEALYADKVRIKVPRIDDDRTYPEIMEELARLGRATDEARRHACSLKADHVSVRGVIDSGRVSRAVSSDESIPVPFVVCQTSEGERLKSYLDRLLKGSGKPAVFRGLPSAREFFSWARQLALAVAELHKHRFVHGTLSPERVLVFDGNPIGFEFIDSEDQELLGAIEPQSYTAVRDAYMCPDGEKSMWSDIYSLGAVMFYLATGQPPPRIEEGRSHDEIKQEIARSLQVHNEPIYAENCAIPDVIASCLNRTPELRAPHVQAVVCEIDIYEGQPSMSTIQSHLSEIEDAVERLTNDSNPIITGLATARVRFLAETLKGMADQRWDFVGNHEKIGNELTRFMSLLGQDDRYLTVSRPLCWSSKNLGVHGRVMSVNRLAAQSGAAIVRVFVMTDEEFHGKGPNGDSVKAVLRGHAEAMRELADKGICTDKSAVDRGGFYTGVDVVSAAEIEVMEREGRHCGLFLKGNEPIVMHPLYRNDGALVAIQFDATTNVDDLRQDFMVRLERSVPLLDSEFLRDSSFGITEPSVGYDEVSGMSIRDLAG